MSVIVIVIVIVIEAPFVRAFNIMTKSYLQLPLQFVEEAPIDALGNDLLRAGLDRSGFCMRSA